MAGDKRVTGEVKGLSEVSPSLLKTGTHGKYWTVGAGFGVEGGASTTYGRVRSLAEFAGLGSSAQASYGVATGAFVFNKEGYLIGGAGGLATPGKGASFTFNGTKLFSCKVHKK